MRIAVPNWLRQLNSIGGIVAGAALLRLLLWWGKFGRPDYPHLFRDDEVYWQAAQELWATGQIGSHKVMPGLPLLEMILGFPGIVYFNMLCDLGTVGLTYYLAQRLLKHEGRARWAASLVALSPGLLYFSNHAYTESLFTLLLVGGTTLLYREKYEWGSLILIFSIWVRPTLDPFIPLWIVAFAWAVHQHAWTKIMGHLLKYLLLYLLLMAPWWWHNYQKYDRFVRLNLGGGEVMYHGQVNLPRLADLDDPQVYDLAAFDHLDDPERRKQAMQAEVWAYWTASPWHLPEAFIKNTIKFWLGIPEVFYGPFAYLVGFGMHAGIFLMAIGIWRGKIWRQRLWWPILLLLLYFTVLHALLHGMPRYRLPLVPLMWLLALAGWVSRPSH